MSEEKKLSPLEIKINAWVTDHLTSVPFVQKIFFIDHIRTMIHAGLSLTEALEVLSKELENKKLKKVIGQIKAGVEQGRQFSEVLAEHPKVFPPIYVKMIASGEVSGKLEESLDQVVIQMQKTQELMSSIRGAMIYPAVILFAMSGIGVMMVTVVLPKMLEMFKEFDAELPTATKVLMAITDFMSKPANMIGLLLVIFLFILSFATGLKKSPPFKKMVHKFSLKLPIAGAIIKKINLARFSLTLSSLLKSTIPIVDATDITAETCGNVLYREALHEAAEKIKTGTPLSEILGDHSNLFPPMVTEMIMVGERTGEIDQLLNELANFYSKEVDKTMKNFTQIIEPVIILVLGVAVAGMAVAVIMPMYTLVQSF